MCKVEKQSFGYTSDGSEIFRYVLKDGVITVGLITLGGALQSLLVPDKNGNPVDIVLGYDTVQAYERQSQYLGALIGRNANRTAGGAFVLNGRRYTLMSNDGCNNLHSGTGFDKRLWSAEIVAGGVRMTRISPDGEDGFPGSLMVHVLYTLENGTLRLTYDAVSDADTVCNLTNHTYFNLAGHNSGKVCPHLLTICGDDYTPTDAQSIPTGELRPVENTAFDFRKETRIGARIEDDDLQLRQAHGYDHNWVVRGRPGILRDCAAVYAPQTGIAMDVGTTSPGVQFYSGNYLEGAPVGKGGAVYTKRCGMCLETQFYPDSLHHPDFPQPILRRGEPYHHETVYRFGVR